MVVLENVTSAEAESKMSLRASSRSFTEMTPKEDIASHFALSRPPLYGLGSAFAVVPVSLPWPLLVLQQMSSFAAF